MVVCGVIVMDRFEKQEERLPEFRKNLKAGESPSGDRFFREGASALPGVCPTTPDARHCVALRHLL